MDKKEEEEMRTNKLEVKKPQIGRRRRNKEEERRGEGEELRLRT